MKIINRITVFAIALFSVVSLSSFTFPGTPVAQRADKIYSNPGIADIFLKLFNIDSEENQNNNGLYFDIDDEGDKDLPDWALLDPEKDGYEGTRTKTFFKYINSLPEKPQTSEVIVAVIDSGFDIDHPALKNNIWKNEKEVNGSAGVDDDNNGYIDDFNGWNFLGDAKYLNFEVTRELKRLKKEGVPESDPYYRRVKMEYDSERSDIKGTYEGLKESLQGLIDAEDVLKRGGYTTDPEKLKLTAEGLKGEYKSAAMVILTTYMFIGLTKEELEKYTKEYEIKNKYLFDDRDPEELIGDDPNNLYEKGYGNNDVRSRDDDHGTHVAGIIAADKDGIGQAPFARLMFLRAVPGEGDERDKDIANAIRYAVDNGADIINMSAGKYFSPNPEIVVEAIKYAEEKGVLFVVSAGNESADIETTINYPRKFTNENGQINYFDNMLVVGASSWMKSYNSSKDPENLSGGYDLVANFSNYSGKIVDVFAPGLEINSTIPNGKYERISGTSMASPEAAGVAAIIKAYFPELTAAQLKEVLSNSVRKYDGLKVKVGDSGSKVSFSSLSRSGGVIDVMNAYEYAKKMKESVN
ncbi:MAG TPA: S8 family serine peptidase [Ignavibacteria bacterium]|nr:S8 family serine peptidase [Ignavibacteria bacterium]